MKKKILYIHHGIGIGGAPLSLLYLVQSLDKNNYDPVVLFLHESAAVKLFQDHNIITLGPVNRYDFPHTKIWWLRWYHVPFFLKICWDTLITYFFIAPKIIKQVTPDMIHLNTSSLIAWGMAAKKYNIPVIWHIRESLAQGYLGLRKKFITNIINRCSDRIIAICKKDGEPWIQDAKTSIIYNAAPTDRFKPSIKTSAPSRPTILFLGGLSYEKGTLFILTIFAQLKNRIPGVQLLIAGSFDISKKYKNVLSPSYHFNKSVHHAYQQVQHNVTLLGTIHNVPEIMALSNVIVFPAMVGHFARPVIEAQLMAKTVVAANIDPLPELITHQSTGYLCDTKEPLIWVNTLQKILLNPSLQQNIGHQAHIVATQRFTLEKQTLEINNLYQSL